MTNWKNIVRGLLLTATIAAGAFGAHRAFASDCCAEGAACCKPGAACCHGKHLVSAR